MAGLFKGCLWFTVIMVAIGSVITFPPLAFVVLVVAPFVIIWKYLKSKGW
jgi:hypothetical protein